MDNRRTPSCAGWMTIRSIYVFWLRRPPYLRWLGAAALIAFAVFVDVRQPATEQRPFAAADLAAGDPLSADSVTWRDVPAGLLPLPVLAAATAARAINRGDPVVPSALSYGPAVPDGWWSIEMRIPESAEAGSAARIVVSDPALAIDGVVLSIFDGGAFEASASGMVAIPPEHADAIARAMPNGTVTVLISP